MPTPLLAGMNGWILMPRFFEDAESNARPSRGVASSRPQSEDHGIGVFLARPPRSESEADTQFVEPAQPGARERRGLHRFRENAS